MLKAHKIVIACITVFFIACLSLVAYINFQMFYPFQVVEFKYPVTKVISKEVKIGNPLKYQVDNEQLTHNVKVDVTYRLICGEFQLVRPNNLYITTKGKNKYINSGFVIPEYTPLGKCRLETISVFHYSLFRDIVIRRSTEDFTVIK